MPMRTLDTMNAYLLPLLVGERLATEETHDGACMFTTQCIVGGSARQSQGQSDCHSGGAEKTHTHLHAHARTRTHAHTRWQAIKRT